MRPRRTVTLRAGGHAKVILVDAALAYVESVNLTRASRDYSMELGVALLGRAAVQVSEVIAPVIGASSACREVRRISVGRHHVTLASSGVRGKAQADSCQLYAP
jgi:phosphatidylserine/phosphatidylglycerophosphate/cardiolipin synthase-like enzyme